MNDQIQTINDARHQYTLQIKDDTKAVRLIKEKTKKEKGDRKFSDKPLKLGIYSIFKKYRITPEQYHGGDLVGNHCRKLMQNSDKIYAERYDLLKEVPVQSCSKIQYRNDTVMTDEDITSSFDKFRNILLLCDSLYSACHRPCGSMTNADLTDAKETIKMLSALWRLEKLSVTVKAHKF